MNDALTKEVQQKVVKDIMEVLRVNNLTTTPNIRDAVVSLLKEVSCAYQNGGK